MIKSSIYINSGITKLLKDPKAIQKDIENLVKAEKKAKETLKELYEGKSKKAYTEEQELMAAQYKAEADKAKKATEDALHEKKAATQKLDEEMCSYKSSIKAKEHLCDVKVKQAQEAKAKAEADAEKAVKVLKEAEAEKAKYLNLKQEYDDKLADLKSRFKGLVG